MRRTCYVASLLPGGTTACTCTYGVLCGKNASWSKTCGQLGTETWPAVKRNLADADHSHGDATTQAAEPVGPELRRLDAGCWMLGSTMPKHGNNRVRGCSWNVLCRGGTESQLRRILRVGMWPLILGDFGTPSSSPKVQTQPTIRP